MELSVKRYNMVDKSAYWNNSVVSDNHSHLGYGTPTFSGRGGDLDAFILYPTPNAFMYNGSQIYHWSPSTGTSYVGQTNKFLMRSVFGW